MGQLDAGKKLMVWSLDEFSEADRFASPYFVGSVAPEVSKQAPKIIVEDPIQVAFGILEKHLGTKIAATIASEIGGGNSAASLAIAAQLGIPSVDGDLMGRAGRSSTKVLSTFSECPWFPPELRARPETRS